jgi:hypothetical protein
MESASSIEKRRTAQQLEELYDKMIARAPAISHQQARARLQPMHDKNGLRRILE